VDAGIRQAIAAKCAVMLFVHAIRSNTLEFADGTSVTAQSLDEPLDAVTTRDRFALIEPTIIGAEGLQQFQPSELGPLIPLGDGLFLDIRFRMLQWHELAAAQGFPKGYIFFGNKATKVKQIGNAVPC
jgi:DNA (cytosine-5)-methyltransferase 1